MKIGRQTFLFNNVYLKNGAAVVGEKEGHGPLKGMKTVLKKLNVKCFTRHLNLQKINQT